MNKAAHLLQEFILEQDEFFLLSYNEKVIPVETSSSSSKKELVSKKVNSSVKVDKKKDLPQTGEKHNEVLWLSILGCIVLAGSLWIFERKYK